MNDASGTETAWWLQLYDEKYFAGNRTNSGYDDYENCRGVLNRWSNMILNLTKPKSLFDVGCAYGFMIDYLRHFDIPAWGMDPSDFALSKVREESKQYIVKGDLPNVPVPVHATYPNGPIGRFDVVTCTEVLEHVPEDLVPQSLMSMEYITERFLVCTIMLEGPGADGDEGHITLKSRDWWEYQFTKHTGLVKCDELEKAFNEDPYAIKMNWAGRIFVRGRVQEGNGNGV